MDTLYAPLTALESLSSPSVASSNKSTRKPIAGQLDDLASALGSSSTASADELARTVQQTKHGIDEAIKGYHKAITKLGSSIDKAVYHPPPFLAPNRFASPSSQALLDAAVHGALVRLGQAGTARAFERETMGAVGSPEGGEEGRLFEGRVREGQRVRAGLRRGDLTSALDWVAKHASVLPPDSPLPFALHRSAYLSLLAPPPPQSSFSSSSSNLAASAQANPSSPAARQANALAYARLHFPAFYERHQAEVKRLLAALLFLPASASTASATAIEVDGEPGPAAASPYADLFAAQADRPAAAAAAAHLEPLFVQAWAEVEGVAEREVLSRAVRAGADGGVARVEKALGVLAAGAVGSTGEGELPIEIPLDPSDRHHSIFVCPVSKELASPSSFSLLAPIPPAAASASSTTASHPPPVASQPPQGAYVPPSIAAARGAANGGITYEPSHFPPYYVAHATTGPPPFPASSANPPVLSQQQPPQPPHQQQQQQQLASNPAVMLKCGHTVVRESLKRLHKGSARGATGAGRAVKCAYCPVETPAGKELELHF